MEILDEVEKIANDVKNRLTSFEEKSKNDLNGIKSSWELLKSSQESLEKTLKQIQDRQDELEALGIRNKATDYVSFRQILSSALLEEAEMLKSLTFGKIVTKAVGDMTTAANLNNYTAPAERGNLSFQPFRRVHARDIVPSTTSNSPITEYPRHLGGEGGANYQSAEYALKPQTDFDFDMKVVTAKTIAHWVRMPTSFLQDHEAMVTFIQTAMIEGLLNREDAELFNGDGVGTNIEGMITAASAFNPGYKVPNPQRIDVLVASIGQLLATSVNGGGFVADFIALNPTNLAQMSLTKDTQGAYVLNNFISPDGRTILGVPVVAHNAVPVGRFLVGDSLQAQHQVYSPITLQFYYEDRDNAIRNAVTVKAEMRIKFAVLQPNGFISETFQNAITTLT